MGLVIACKAFIKALKNPAKALLFLQEEKGSYFLQQDREKRGNQESAHLHFLSIMQQTTRMIDFFKEDISTCTDAQVGAAARKIHEDCQKKLEDLVTIRPILEEPEGVRINIPVGYDPQAIKVVGKVTGNPPYSGTLIHGGWKAHKRSLPKPVSEQAQDILFPAEIEV